MLQSKETHVGLQTNVNTEEQTKMANQETIILPLIPQWTHSWGHQSNLTKHHKEKIKETQLLQQDEYIKKERVSARDWTELDDTSSSLSMNNMVILDEYHDNESLSDQDLQNLLTQNQASEQSLSPEVEAPMPINYPEPSHSQYDQYGLPINYPEPSQSQYDQEADSNGDSNGRARLHVFGLQKDVSKTNLKAVFGHYGQGTNTTLH
jgi:hypothetical protein